MSYEVEGSNEIRAAVNDLIANPQVREVFDLTEPEMKALMNVRVTDTGLDVSPNFQSIGWGENDSDSLTVNLSDLANGQDVIKHELKHALHCLVCASLFKGAKAVELFHRFYQEVVEDPGFYRWRQDQTGVTAQNHWQEIKKLQANPNLSVAEVERNALMLGSVLYQHAYFVDPLICEAVASTKDTGFVGINGLLNRTVGLIIPGDQFIEGYGWLAAQKAFGRAEKEKKALLIRKKDYQRREYFSLVD